MSRVLSALFCALLAAGCSDAPLGPGTSAGSSDEPGVIADGPSATGPLFLIGDSPLISLLLDPSTGQHTLRVEVEVTRGLVEVKLEDKFKIRTTVVLTADGNPFPDGTVGPQKDALVAVKDDGVRGGGTVALQPCVDIPSELWTKLVSADVESATVEATATVELVMLDGAGKEHVLDEVTQTAGIDPKGDG